MDTREKNNNQSGRFCIYCGEHLTGCEAFCPRCGTALSLPPPAVNTQTSPQPFSGIYQQTRRSAPPDRAGRRRAAGLAGFTTLAVLVTLLFILMKVPVLWIGVTLAVLLALCLLQRKLAVKGWLSGILLLLGGAVLSFALLVIGMRGIDQAPGSLVPDAPQYAAVKPTSSDTVITFGQVRIVIPGGTMDGEETLTLETVDSLPPPIKELEPFTPAFDVSLGELTVFEKPIIIEIPFDASKLGDDDPSDAFLAMFYDEETQMWDAVPCDTDAEAGVIRLTMYHLTTVQCYYSKWKGGSVYDNGTVSVIYLRSGNTENLAKYEDVVGEPVGDGKTPRFVEDVAKYATDILEAYREFGLGVPDHPSIYVTADKNNYNSLTGNVCVSLSIATQADPENELLRNLAHELFHTTQQATLGTLYYQSTKGQNIDFWMEATADYLGNTGVWEALGRPAVNAYEYYGIGFFDVGLFAVNGSHEYDAASFVKYMQDAQRATPLQLVNMASSIQPIQNSFLSVYGGKYESMLGWYEEFMEYSLFDNSSRFLSKSNAKLLDSISDRSAISFDLDENGDAKPDAAPIEGRGTLTFKDQYTAGFHVVTVNCDTTLTLTPDAFVKLYVCSSSLSVRGYERRVDAYAGEPTEITLTKDDFLVIARVSATAGLASFAYTAQPTVPDLTGTWNCTQFEFIDCEADAAFWSAVGEGYGYDKSGYINAHNESMRQQGGYVYFTLYSAGINAYSAELGRTGQSEVMPFSDVTVTGSTIVCRSNYNGLWGTLTLTVTSDGQTMTGTFRAQTIYYYGDGTYPAVDVIAVTAVREELAQ
jgi:hypothetical protein